MKLSFESTRSALGRATADLPPAARDAVSAWMRLLCEWNARIDLTAARTPEELVDLMLADALTLAPHVAQGARVVDVGTGAGAPGLALALVRPDLVVTLCEPLAKRASFLRTVLGTVGRTDVTLTSKRGEDLPTERGARAPWDVAMSRATLAPEAWLALAARLVVPGGHAWVLLAKDEAPTREGATMEEQLAYEWPETKAQRRAARYRIG
jgi:16S rRNA (guanine527-N7)-methyltransferase